MLRHASNTRSRVYILSFDNPINSDYKRPYRRLSEIADVDRLSFKTTIKITKNNDVSFREMCSVVTSILDKKKGSCILFSAFTGNAYVCNNRGNRKGKLIRQ